MSERIINAILVKPGEEPEICHLPEDTAAQTEAICDLLEGNFGATEFFDLKNGAALFILSNDLSIPLGLKPNRRFPGADFGEIIFGNAIFIAAYSSESGQEGVIDMPERICRMFIEQIKRNFKPCRGDEKPHGKADIYYENEGTPEERAFRWQEIQKPSGIEKAGSIKAGRATWYQADGQEFMEINGRYFKQAWIIKGKKPLH